MKTLLLILLITILWGVWGFFSKLAIIRIGQQVALYTAFIFLLLEVGYLIYTQQLFPLKNDMTGIGLAIIAGLATALASILFYIVLHQKPAGYLITVTALYPLVTILLSIIFLHEGITWVKSLGFVFALIALVLLNI